MRYHFSQQQFTQQNESPDKASIIGSDQTLSWNQLENQSNILKKVLLDSGVPKGHPIIIYGHTEANFIVAMVSCMQLDIPYIPIDTIYPLERITKIKEITGSQLIIDCTTSNQFDEFSLVINNDFCLTENSTPNFTPENIHWFENDPLHYIMFTSGSTGEPKGVQITKQAIVSFAKWLNEDYRFTQEEVFMNQAPFSFDLSLYNIISFLAIGGTIYLASRNDINEHIFINKLKQTNCSTWISTPSFIYLYLREKEFTPDNLPSLKNFIFIGEELTNKISEKLIQLFPNARIINAYGPTEATVATTWIDIDTKILQNYPSLPIGYPKQESRVYVEPEFATEENPGEILIEGDHVSMGYFKRAELNAEKFYITPNGTRGFKTGDLGYIKNDILFFSGRKDSQIKFNGYRIELGEINSVINNHGLVKLASTVPLKRDNEVKAIITFVQLTENQENFETLIKKDIAGKLPPYMIPKSIIKIREFPFNTNHKIDTGKLVENFKKGQYK